LPLWIAAFELVRELLEGISEYPAELAQLHCVEPALAALESLPKEM
jgi:hypothetical protein